jgi:hypothetical protein
VIELSQQSADTLTWVIGATVLTFLMFPFARFGVWVARKILEAIAGLF